MATIEESLRSQLRNIEATYGRSVENWLDLIWASRLSRHGEIVRMLKNEHDLSHAGAHRLALVSLTSTIPASAEGDPIVALYAGRSSHLRSLYDQFDGRHRRVPPTRSDLTSRDRRSAGRREHDRLAETRLNPRVLG